MSALLDRETNDHLFNMENILYIHSKNTEISVIVIEPYILDELPEKKHVSSPNRGLYEAHFGAVNSTIATRIDKIKGNP